MRHSSMFCQTTLLAVLVVVPALSAAEPSWRWDTVPDSSVALVGPHGTVWRFNYGADLTMPYFDPVSLTTGESLTWNAPPDHEWHHALWFCWHTINGVNYWEHIQPAGRPLGQTRWSTPKISTNDDGSATIQLQLSYATSDSPVVLRETRVIHITAPNDRGEFDFDWDATFLANDNEVVLDRTPIPPDPNGKPWGGYAGLSLRFAEKLADRSVITDRGAAEFDPTGVFRSRGIACEYRGTVNGRSAGIAVLSHPTNPRHPTPWYAIRSEMSYLNPAFLESEPYTIGAGESLRLRYRINVHPGHWDSARLNAAATKFAAAE